MIKYEEFFLKRLLFFKYRFFDEEDKLDDDLV